MKHDYFGAEVAASYDDDGPMFAADTLGPTVDFLAALAGDGAALEFGDRYGSRCTPACRARRSRPWHRPLGGDGREAPRETGRGEGNDDDR